MTADADRAATPEGGETPSLLRYVARQPIFDAQRNVVAYELLFRSSLDNVFRCDSADRASSSVIADSLLVMGLDSLTGGVPAFLNFTREVLVGDFATLLPATDVVIEVLETVKPDEEVIAACRRLADLGYVIALDDFEWAPEWEPLLEIARIVKVDFLATKGEDRLALAERLRRKGIQVLAEKVESIEDFKQAVAAGYELFQGFFFAKPEIVIGRDVPAYKLNYLQILRVVNAPSPDLSEIEEVVRRETSLCYKLLRHVNSASFGFRAEVASIGHALSLLGLREIRKWVSLLAMAGMSGDKPSELVRTALVRARFCELLAPAFDLGGRETDLFLLGMFSLMDAILDRPLASVLEEVSLAADLRSALVDGSGELGAPYFLACSWERGDWDLIARCIEDVPNGGEGIPEAYFEALRWANEVFTLAR